MTPAKRAHPKRRSGTIKRGEPLSATQARIHFGEVIKRAYMSGEHVVVEKDGIPMVVILSVPQYERLLQQLRLACFDHVSRLAGRDAEQHGLTEEQLEREMQAIKERLHRQTYGG